MSAVSPSLTQAQLKNAQIIGLENETNPTPRDIRLVASLIDRLRDNSVAERLNSFRNISVIARVLGPVRTRDELIPYIHEFSDDDDAVLLVLAEELGKLVDLIGGYQYLGVIFEPLETLAGSEDSTIREKVIETLGKISKVLTPEQAVRCFLPFFRHLAIGEWFTSRQSACAVFPLLYPLVPVACQAELRGLFVELTQDESPMVRRAACQSLSAAISVIDPQHTLIFVSCFSRLASDEQDSIRLVAVSACPVVAGAARQLNEVARVFPSIFALCTDKSWRVRYVAASKFSELCAAVGENQFKGSDFVDCFTKLMTDGEPEVRSAAASQVANVAKLLGGEKTLKVLFSPLKSLASDPCEFTRAALARCVMQISSVLSHAATAEHLLPLFLQILKDPSPDVKLSLMVDLSCAQDVLGEGAIANAILPTVCQLAVEKNWRVRLAIIEQVPHITQQLGARFYEEKLSDLSMAWMGDPVASIREASASNLVQLSAAFGSQWAEFNVIPKVIHLSTRKSYQYRQLALRIFADLVPVLGEEFAMSIIYPHIEKFVETESVINVRMNTVRTLYEIGLICTNRVTLQNILSMIDKEIGSDDREMTILSHTCVLQLQKKLKALNSDPVAAQ